MTNFVDLELEIVYCFTLLTLPDLSVVRCDYFFEFELYGEVVCLTDWDPSLCSNSSP